MKKLVFSSLLLVFVFLGGSECRAVELAKAKVIELTGEVRYKNPDDLDWSAVSKDMELIEGASLFVGPDSECQLAFGDDFKSVTRLKQDTRVVLKSISAQPQLELSAGEVFALVRNLKKESSFRVSTPTAVSTVRGTAFSVAAEGIGSAMNSTVQVYEHSVGFNPIDQPDKEIPVWEGHGATMAPDGTMDKEFELSSEDMQAGKDFMTEAFGAMALEKSGPATAPEATSDAESPKEATAGEDDKKSGGPNPPGPDSGGPTEPRGPEADRGSGGGGPLTDARLDSAVDGVVMNMAHDSEFSKSETFGGSAMSEMFERLADLNGGEGPSRMDSTMFAETVKNAIEQTDYFQNMPPDVQDRMMEAIDRHAETSGPMAGSERGFGLDGQPLFIPDGGAQGSAGEAFFGTMMDPSLMGPPPGAFVNPSDLASFINDHPDMRPRDLATLIDFMFAIRTDYNSYVTSNGGSDSGYYGSLRTITNFAFIKDDVPITGSIKFLPIDADPSPGTGVHDHDGPGSGPNFIHASSVVVLDVPSGIGGSVVATPGTVEVSTS